MVAPASFIDLAAATAELATPLSKPLLLVGEPSVKNTTIFLASSRPDVWPAASCNPKSACVAPAGLMALTVDFKSSANDPTHEVRFFITWL